MIRIVIGGDINPSGTLASAFERGAATEIFHDLLDEISSADLAIVNLEAPLVSQQTPIAKVGRILGANPDAIQGLKAANWHILNLANNHSFDHGTRGLRETMDTIERSGLSFVGAGLNIDEANQPLVKNIKGERITIYAMAEQEFSVAGVDRPGANPLDVINFINTIRLHKRQGTFIVLLHGGNELYPYPSPEMVRRCRFMIDMGADAVACCHAHFPLPWEYYSGKPIVYGLGNLIFEPPRKKPVDFYRGYLAKIIIKDHEMGLEIIPYRQGQKAVGAQMMNETERNEFFVEMNHKNELLKDDSRLSNLWKEYCRRQSAAYMSGLFAYNRLMRKFNRPLLEILHPDKAVLGALLLVQCEAHREALTSILRDKTEANYR